MNFLEELQKAVGPQLQKQLSQNLNIPSTQSAGILAKVAPLILGGLKRQMENHGGEKRVVHIVDKYGKEEAKDEKGIADIISGVMKQRQPDPGLGGLLGDAGHKASDLLGGELGIGKMEAGRLIAIIAPIILGLLKAQHRSQPTSAQTRATSNTGVGGGGNMGILGSILDRDGDGNVLDDVAGMVFNQGGGFGGRQQPQQGGLGGILGSVLGGGQPRQQQSSGGLGGLLGSVLGGQQQQNSGGLGGLLSGRGGGLKGALAKQVLGALLKGKR